MEAYEPKQVRTPCMAPSTVERNVNKHKDANEVRSAYNVQKHIWSWHSLVQPPAASDVRSGIRSVRLKKLCEDNYLFVSSGLWLAMENSLS